MDGVAHISEAAKQLGVTPQHLLILERGGRIYSEFDIALLRSIGVGFRPSKLRRAEEVVGAGA